MGLVVLTYRICIIHCPCGAGPRLAKHVDSRQLEHEVMRKKKETGKQYPPASPPRSRYQPENETRNIAGSHFGSGGRGG